MNKLIVTLCCLLSTSVIAKNAPVVLLSIDGFSAEYIEQYQPKNLLEIKHHGLSSDALTPVFPTKTFPNHLTMVTGEYPSKHGLIHNSFYDRVKKKKYRLGAGKKDPTWLKAEPIWVEAERNNIISASYFWPESEATINGIKPTYCYPYNEQVSDEERLSQIIRWLEMPESEKPYFIVSYFSLVDSAGHDFGSNSTAVEKAVDKIDRLIGEFRQELDKRALDVNLIIVSDHGMYDLEKNREISLKNLPLPSELDLIHNGETQLYIYESDSAVVEQTVNKLNAAAGKRYRAYRNGKFPAHWHFNQVDSSMPDIIVSATPPYTFNSGYLGMRNKGTHGYDPKDTIKMNGIFISEGPNIKAGHVEAFSNIYIHSFVAKLLGLPNTKLSNSNPLLIHKAEKQVE